MKWISRDASDVEVRVRVLARAQFIENRIILNKIKMKKILPLLFLSLFFLFSAHSALAVTSCSGPLVPCGGMDADGNAQDPCKFCHLFVMFNNLVQFLLFCIVPLFAVMGIVVAGVFYIFSRGNPDTIKKAKGIIEAVAIGLLIVFTAWLLINMFFTYLNVTIWTGPGEGWFRINCE